LWWRDPLAGDLSHLAQSATDIARVIDGG